MPPPPPRSAQAEERRRGDAARDPGALRLPSFASARLSSPYPDTPPHPHALPGRGSGEPVNPGSSLCPWAGAASGDRLIA